ncbi:MAG: hypothetical protein Q9201_005289 [Fulgogasparrea decipioides]
MKGRQASLPLTLSNLTLSSTGSSSRYICLQCRHRASVQQTPPLPTLSQNLPLTRSYADNSSGIDRFQEGLTGLLKRRLFRQDDTPSPLDEESRIQQGKEKGTGKQPQEQPSVESDVQTQNADIGQRPLRETAPVTDDPDYEPATSGEGLEMIGGPTGWWEKAWDEHHQFRGFMRPTPVRDGPAVRKAIERALVEVLALKGGRPKFQAIVDQSDRPWELGPIGEFRLWESKEGKTRLRWKRWKDGVDLQESLRQARRHNQEAQKEDVLDDAGNEKDLRGPENTQSELDDLTMTGGSSSNETNYLEVSSQSRMVEDLEPKTANTMDEAVDMEDALQMHPEGMPDAKAIKPAEKKYTGLQGSINLTDPWFKFAVTKRVMQLTGIRIPDPTIQAIDSSQALWEHLTKKPEPKKLAQLLVEGQDRLQKKKKKLPLLSTLPNVKVMPTKHVPEMVEAALGRQKVIERELDRHGIPVPFKDVMEQIQEHQERRLRLGRNELDGEQRGMDTMESPNLDGLPQHEDRADRGATHVL